MKIILIGAYGRLGSRIALIAEKDEIIKIAAHLQYLQKVICSSNQFNGYKILPFLLSK